MALNDLYCTDVALRNYPITHSLSADMNYEPKIWLSPCWW